MIAAGRRPPSIPPPRRRRPRRHVTQTMLRHLAQPVGARAGTAPTMRLLVAVDEVPLVVRILRRLHPRLELARCALEEEAVHVADVDVQLVDELGTDGA